MTQDLRRTLDLMPAAAAAEMQLGIADAKTETGDNNGTALSCAVSYVSFKKDGETTFADIFSRDVMMLLQPSIKLPHNTRL